MIQKVMARDRRLTGFRYYELMVHAYVVILIVSNLVGQKLTAVGPFRFSGAQLLFPITYIFSDIFTEVYGYAGSRRAIWIALFANAAMAAMGYLILAIPAAPEWPGANQQAFRIVFGAVPRMIVASLTAFWAGEFVNSYVMAKLKLLTKGRWLWTRTIGSTVSGQAIDSIIVTTVFFWGTIPFATILITAGSGYLFKVVYEALATPLTYLVVARLKKAEGVDVYDEGTNFNPFARSHQGNLYLPAAGGLTHD